MFFKSVQTGGRADGARDVVPPLWQQEGKQSRLGLCGGVGAAYETFLGGVQGSGRCVGLYKLTEIRWRGPCENPVGQGQGFEFNPGFNGEPVQ